MKKLIVSLAWILVTLTLVGLALSGCMTVYTGAPPQNPSPAPSAATVAPTTIALVPSTEVATVAESSLTAAPPPTLPAPTDTPTLPPPTDPPTVPLPRDTVTAAPTETSAPVPPADTATPADKAPSVKGTGRGGTVPPPVVQPSDTPVPGGAVDKKTGPGGTPSPAPHTRTLYSDVLLIGAKLLPVLGGKADVPVNRGNALPVGCEIVDVKGLDYHWTKPSGPPQASVDHGDHGYTVSRLSDDPRDLGANMHLWYNAPSNIWVRVTYTVRENWDVDCNIAGWTQAEP